MKKLLHFQPLLALGALGMACGDSEQQHRRQRKQSMLMTVNRLPTLLRCC